MEECWTAACVSGCRGGAVDVQALIAALRPSRRWFWDDPDRHRRERVNMLGAWQKIVAHAMETFGPVDDDLAAAVAREFATRRRARERLFPDARGVLETLRARGVPLGLVTNGDVTFQRDKIERHGLGGFFDVVIIESEFGAGKPDEAVYRHALGALGMPAADVCMVGDHLVWDVEGAQRVGITGVWLDRADGGLPAGSAIRPDYVIRSLTALTEARS